MGAEAAGTTAGVVNALALGAAMGSSGAGTTAGVVSSLAWGALFAEGPAVYTATAEATDLTIANPFTATADFLLLSSDKGNMAAVFHASSNIQTTLVIDVGPATTWTGQYIVAVLA
jgi:hypothetical protein